MKTSSIRKNQLEPTWHVLDAQGVILGRLATNAATLLRGKGKVSFVPYLDCGDHVVVVNAAKVTLSGNKAEEKAYYHYSGYPGGMKTALVKHVLQDAPDRVIRSAVKGMLPKNKLQNEWMKRLHVYADAEHPHAANVTAA
jgi:large subunit ribosomal protein L13